MEDISRFESQIQQELDVGSDIELCIAGRPRIVYANEILGRYTIEFDSAKYADFLRSFGYADHEIQALQIRFSAKESEDQGDMLTRSNFAVMGRYNDGEQKIDMFLDTTYATSRSKEEFESECLKTLLHETGHAIDKRTGLKGQTCSESRLLDTIDKTVSVISVGTLATLGYEWYRSKRDEARRTVVLGGLAVLGSQIAAIAAIGKLMDTNYYYRVIDENERFAREFESYHTERQKILRVVPALAIE